MRPERERSAGAARVLLTPACSPHARIARADANGAYTGECTTLALSGFVRSLGDADAAVDRLWSKQYEAAGKAI